ncbi:MAG: AGE family epimerase/isomerase [Sedimentisphaeraceae bacterium JB056]
MKTFEQLQKIYSDNLTKSIIPFWMSNSPDWDNGGTFTCLDDDGSVYDPKKYIWLQGRSVWMFCRLYNTQEKNEEYLKIAKLGLDFIEKNAIDSKGRYYFSLMPDGTPYFYQRKVYGAVFCMLAYLEYFNATGQQEYFDKSVDLFWKIRDWINDPSLLDRPIFKGLPKTSSLADVMVLASMAIELAAVDKQQAYLDVMADSLKNIDRHYDTDKNILMETVALDGTDLTKLPEGRFFNPGHSIEVAWFMLHLLEFLPDAEKESMAFDIIRGSMDFGWDKEFGGLYYFMDVENKPTLQLESDMKLWWPHTEAIYALGLAYKKTGSEFWLDILNDVHDYTFDHFVDEENGGWYGYCDRRGNLTHTSKGGNYKGFFHVPRAMLLTSQL